MKNTLLLPHFDLLATAPSGVAKLRELILTLAVQGKLVPQDPADEPASELLKRIRAEKDRRMAEGKIKRDKPLAPIGEEEQPFELPAGWEWVRLGTITNISTGKLDANAAVAGGQYPFFTCSNTPLAIDKHSFDCCAVLLAGNGDFNLKHYTGKFDAYQRTYVIEPILLDLKFLYFTLKKYIGELTKNQRGSAIPYLKLGDITDPLIPIPPLPEQSRIVARVEELMRVCDALETQGRLQAAQHTLLVNTLLATLTDSATPDELADNWQRVAQHFDTLLDRPSAIDALEQTILQLAVRGQLVPQDPTDEPASELLKRIRTEKDRLIAAGKIKRDKPLAPIGEDEQPFELPPGWEWVRLNALLQKIGAGSTPLGGREVYVNDGVKFLRSQNVWDDGLRLDGVAFIRPETHAKMAGTTVFANDLLFNITGASIGRCAVVPSDFDEANVSQHVTILRTLLPNLNTFLHKVLVSRHVQQAVMDVQVGVSREGLSIAKLGQFLIPLPPLPEQARIVARVAHLRSLCAELRQRLTQSQTTQTALAEALVTHDNG